MNQDKVCFRINASPLGKLSGLISFSYEQHSIQLLVLPKMWIKEKKEAQFVIPETEQHLSFILYELSSLDIIFSRNIQKTWKVFFEQFRLKLEDPESSVTLEDKDAQLLSIKQIKPKPNANKYAQSAPSSFLKNLEALFNLAVYSQKDKSLFSGINQSQKDDHLGFTVSRLNAHEDSESFKHLVQKAFIQEIERLWQKLKQSYLVTTESLGVIRGRLTNRGLVSLSQGLPSIECSYDQFTDAVPLYQIMVTVLDIIAQGSFIQEYLGQEIEIFRGITRKANRLRQSLGHITSLPRSLATHQVNQIRLNRLQAEWSLALDLAKIILLHEPPSFSGGQEGHQGIIWTVQTNDFWEMVLKKSLESAEVQVHPKVCVQPWNWMERVANDKKSIDLVLTYKNKLVIADAKYKFFTTPSAQDQYQIFAYSLLSETYPESSILSEAYPECAVLIYPYYLEEELADQDHVKLDRQAERGQLNVEKSESLTLKVIKVPYPQGHNLSSQHTWDEYLNQVGKLLRDKLFVSQEQANEDLVTAVDDQSPTISHEY